LPCGFRVMQTDRQSLRQTEVFRFSGDRLLLTVNPAEQKSLSHGTDVTAYNPLIVM